MASTDATRVLVVDDDERVAASVRRSLEYVGYAVTVAHDGPQAIAAAHRERPALVVLDVMNDSPDAGVRAYNEAPGVPFTWS